MRKVYAGLFSSIDGVVGAPNEWRPDHDSAFSHRDALVGFGAGTSWRDPAEDQDRIAVARRCTAALDQYPSGAYINFVHDDGPEAVLRAYSAPKLTRLTAVKTVLGCRESDPGYDHTMSAE
jgi:hypothetical protein